MLPHKNPALGGNPSRARPQGDVAFAPDARVATNPKHHRRRLPHQTLSLSRLRRATESHMAATITDNTISKFTSNNMTSKSYQTLKG